MQKKMQKVAELVNGFHPFFLFVLFNSHKGRGHQKIISVSLHDLEVDIMSATHGKDSNAGPKSL